MTTYKAKKAVAALVLAHGAGAGQKSAWMVNAAQALADRGITTATFDFPYITAGRKVPDRAPVLEAHWREVVDDAREKFADLPLLIGGKSMGGRIATQIAAREEVAGVSGVVLLGYPLHPPGQPDKRRDAHLRDVRVPMLFVQGSNDTFGNEAEMTSLMPFLQKATLHVIGSGDHSFKVKGGAKAVAKAFEEAFETVTDWVKSLTLDR
ncbi:MAG: alpha/beta fold hydrolase [Vicinamibacterales bacterium]